MEIDRAQDTKASISAYAKLEFDQFSFFIQTLTLVIGRKANREDNVDVHLGMSKSISRVHAKIFYQFDAMTWELEVLGKNGAFVNEHYVQAGQTCQLTDTDKLQIADTEFFFLLPKGVLAPPKNSIDRHHASQRVYKKLVASTLSSSEAGRIDRALPLAPHHLMQSRALNSDKTCENGADLWSGDNSINLDAADATASPASKVSLAHQGVRPPPKQVRKTSKVARTVEDEDPLQDLDDEDDWSAIPRSISTTPEPDYCVTVPMILPSDPKTEEERRAQEAEIAAQHAAQLLHQERLARQAQVEEEGLILPPPETDPAKIAKLQKPTASYATMIYNAITSHDKKKMTLAQIYSWICIYHPYYRYALNGWQNSIRHNLSLNKAFMKVSRTENEPGKGSFWAVDPESEILFEGGVYKKKPPRTTPLVTTSRGSPVVMKDNKLALNPSFFVGELQGKAEEVLYTIREAVEKQIGVGEHSEDVSQLSRILALALATHLRQSVVLPANPRHIGNPHSSLAQAYKPPSAMPQTVRSTNTYSLQRISPAAPLSNNQGQKVADQGHVVHSTMQTSQPSLTSDTQLRGTSTSVALNMSHPIDPSNGTTPVVNIDDNNHTDETIALGLIASGLKRATEYEAASVKAQKVSPDDGPSQRYQIDLQ